MDMFNMGLSRCLRGKEFAYSAGASGDADWISGWGLSLGEGNGNPLHNSCPENPMERGAWWATVQKKSRTQQK